MSLSEQDREALRETWDFGPFGTEAHQFAAVEAIVARHVNAALTEAAERVEAVTANRYHRAAAEQGNPVDRAFIQAWEQAARIVRGLRT